ncbi:MAG: DUF4832 domain-containing protein [Bythopirellula sp.]|nr:DUF4832 domain-containing protein [Bythopirellula sp.]
MAVIWLSLVAAAIVCCTAVRTNGQVTKQTITFQSSNAEFPNPERGFLRYTSLTSPGSYPQIRAQGQTLVWGRVIASEFRNQPLSVAFLDSIQNGFKVARANGLKVKFRLAYNDGFQEPDAPKSVILNHIQQLKPLWKQNKDVIFNLDAGFIGSWGEWHNSTNGLDNTVDRSEILHAILDALPVDRTVAIRYPHFKREIFSGSQQSDAAVITAANAFDGSDLSRVGHHNDCFLSSATDVGTYVNPGGLWPLSRELDYIGGESRYSVHGCETCALHARNNSLAAIAMMETLHTDYLNLDYHPEVIQKWKDDGKFEEIQRRLGYRFELQTATLPNAVKPSGLLKIEFTIDNVGFGELFNPRNVEITLKNNSTGVISSAPLQIDPRFWSGGTSNDVQALLSVPDDMPEGTYTVGIKMPDLAASLRNDVRYSIRFANDGVWDSVTGINVLKTDLQITSTAPGASYQVGAEFEEVQDTSILLLAGDFDAVDILLFKQFLNLVAGRLPVCSSAVLLWLGCGCLTIESCDQSRYTHGLE